MPDFQTQFSGYDKEASIWRERLTLLMKERGLNRSSLGKEMYIFEQLTNNRKTNLDLEDPIHKSGKANCERRMSRYLNVGLANQKFPKFEHMLDLATYFDVQIGYLIGETDCESFDIQKICEYTGLTEEAVKAIKLLNTRKPSLAKMRYTSRNGNKILNNFLCSPNVFRLFEALAELDSACDSSSPFQKEWAELEKEYDYELLANAIQFHDEFLPGDNKHNEKVLREAGINDNNQKEFLEAVRRVSHLLDCEYAASQREDDRKKAADLFVFKEFTHLIDELYPM